MDRQCVLKADSAAAFSKPQIFQQSSVMYSARPSALNTMYALSY